MGSDQAGSAAEVTVAAATLAPARVVRISTAILAATCLRVVFAFGNAATSIPAALLFAAVLLLIARDQLAHLRLSWQVAATGITGGAVLLLLPVVGRGWLTGIAKPNVTLVFWSVCVTAVAVTEELALRGALFDAVKTRAGELIAVLYCAVAFALIHVPLYGWRAAPIDLAAGLWLGSVRLWGGVTAAATAHTLADWGGGWLV